ncbi:hypothetical protein LPB19_08240 [Marinobacter salinisoli]|uniref:MFS transporter permease n=1 Tax=Marinobacter salinisoli TaxID=2769486 RepID=A0ABX7MW24_9GAMM|nr:DUF6064 family protein [Marinobacter salinisoli]QSP96353.1 hypothetical protein LPB19_08240 [Marinobacter salinisoli]
MSTSSVWLSYSLQDLLMFGPEAYLRLYVRINQDFWPWQWPVLLLGLLVPVLLQRPERGLRRLAWFTIAGAWCCSGVGFLMEYYSQINWPAMGFGWAFVAQGVLFAFIGLRAGEPVSKVQRRGAFASLWWLAILLLPGVTVLEYGSARAVALFGLAPGVTVAATNLLPGLLNQRLSWLLVPIPLLWMAFSAATFWVLQTYWLLAVPVAGLLMLVLGFWLSPSPAQSPGLRSARHDPARR